MKKKLVAAILCGAMAFSLVACGGNNHTAKDENSSTQSESNKDETNQDESNKGETSNKKETPARKYLKQVVYSADGVKTSEVETWYDQKGRETKLRQSLYTANGEGEPNVTENEYNWVEDGNTAKVQVGGRDAMIYTYDDAGRVIKKVTDAFNLRYEYSYTYVGDKLDKEERLTYLNEELYFQSEIVYDADGRTAKTSTTDQTGNKTVLTITYECDAKGKILSITNETRVGNEPPTTSKFVNFYDEKGHIYKAEKDGVLSAEYECDENGNEIKMISYNGDKIAYEFYYEYY